MNYFKRLWAVSGDESIPGNDRLVYKVYDFLAAFLLLVVLTIMLSLIKDSLGRFITLCFAFAFGWQFFWWGHIRAARKKLRDGD